MKSFAAHKLYLQRNCLFLTPLVPAIGALAGATSPFIDPDGTQGCLGHRA